MDPTNKLKRLFSYLYGKLFRLNDSPQRIAIGFGFGVFLGMLPGTGPVASLVMAALLRVNKAAALLGSLLTNTWLSLVCLFLAIKSGDWIFGSKHSGIFNLIMPVLAGYFIISLGLGILAFFLILTYLKFRRGEPGK